LSNSSPPDPNNAGTRKAYLNATRPPGATVTLWPSRGVQHDSFKAVIREIDYTKLPWKKTSYSLDQ
jgi:hypothetical protein